jgi:nitrile hydratase
MNGPQDLGGRAGFGPVIAEPGEPFFHADWERRVLGLTLACGALGHWTLDGMRHARESLPPKVYYNASYFEIWMRALENLLIAHGEVTRNELSSGKPEAPALRPDRKMPPAAVAGILAKGAPADRPAERPARFAPGDAVRTTATVKQGHTRLPSYARDKVGVVHMVHGCHVLPDASAHGLGECPEWLYSVEFEGQTLWGAGAEPGTSMLIDAWEGYLEPA